MPSKKCDKERDFTSPECKFRFSTHADRLTYKIVFDDSEQLDNWFEFVRKINLKYRGEGNGFGKKIQKFIKDAEGIL